MTLFFFLLEIFIYGFSIYIFYTKKELGVIYLPFIFFSFVIITPAIPIGLFYGLITLLVISILKKSYNLLRENVFSILIFIYYSVLLFQASDSLKFSLVYNVLIFFISLPLIAIIYREHGREVIMKELTQTAILVLVVFVINVIMASLTKYSESMYGIKGGVLFGNLKATDLNIIGIAMFVVLYDILKRGNYYVTAIYVLSLVFILLTLRRSAMLVSVMGIPFVLLSTLTKKSIGRIVMFFLLALVLGTGVYLNTGFASMFKERYELRNLDDRDLEEEKRFFEYEILLQDMFVYKDYSPVFGHGLFDSAGNYGKGIFEERTLHADLPSIAHSSGFLGVLIYLLMIITCFTKAIKRARTKTDFYAILFGFLVFVLYTITGRYTQVETMLLLFMVVSLPHTNTEESEAVLLPEEEQEPAPSFY